ncbi:MAG: DNA recombination protein RmuC [Bacteroidota bacterium]
MEYIFLITGIIVGLIAGYLFAKSKFFKPAGIDPAAFNQIDKEKGILEQQLHSLQQQNEQLKEEAKKQLSEVIRINSELMQWKTEHKNLDEKLNSQKKEMEELHVQFKQQFENIANKIVHDNSQRIQQQHKEKLDDVLNPLKEKIEKFENRVKETHEERIREHQSLKEQIVQLQLLNKTIGDEARNLTSALKGQTKTQGNWGELILEKVLMRSGLTKGREYEIQSSMTNEDGRRLQPDVVINLPDNKHLVVDSKVSLIAYERFYNTEDETERALFLKEHLNSLRRHIKDLGAKNYQQLYQLNTLDFVLLFIPVEPAFALAVENDPELFNDAFEKNIVIVTTSTLLATLRTIASIWRIELQNRNAMEIARQSGDMYDKFVALFEDLTVVGNRLKSTTTSYEDAMKKLYTGNGNLIRRVEKIKQLGVKTTKSLPQALLDRADDIDEITDAKNES